MSATTQPCLVPVAPNRMTRVCHISPVHCVPDNRILHRQCRSLQEAGYAVTWIARHNKDEVREGVHIVALPTAKSRLQRWLFSGWVALWKALQTKSSVYHFHDPEFMLHALLLRILGKRVIYDIHENYVSSVSQKAYIPPALRTVAGKTAGWLEKLVSNAFECVIAERYYEERFPSAVKVLNYPRISADDDRSARSDSVLLYTGNVHRHRGAFLHARLPSMVEGVRVKIVGHCPPPLHAELARQNTTHIDRLEFTGVGSNVPYDRILSEYANGAWLAGLAIFAPNHHFEKKELTKFFEYMQFGIPIIASDFPTWRDLIEGNQCGICVDPNSDKQIVAAIERLRDDADLWNTMSQNGFNAVRENYSWVSQEKSLLALYNRLAPLR